MTRHMWPRVMMMLAALGLSGVLQTAEAQLSDDVSLILKISIDPSIGGTAIGAASGTIQGVPASIEEASWADTHSRQSPLFEGGIGLRAGDFADILGLFNYGRAGAEANAIGELGGELLQAAFDDYQFWGLEGGVRLRGVSGVGPYGFLTGGFRRVSEIQTRLVAGSTVTAATGYEASTVPSVAVGGGVLWGNSGFAMGFEVAIRYAGAPKAPADRALEPASDAGSRWSLPIGLVFQF